MKLNYNQKYTTIATYSVIVFTLCIVIYKFAFTWEASFNLISKGIGVMAPFIIALILAYFISPMINSIEKYLLSSINTTRFKLKSNKIKRVLSIFIAYVVIIGFIVILLSIVLPQLIASGGDISQKLPDLFTQIMDTLENSTITFGNDLYTWDLSLVNDYIMEQLPKTFEQITAMISSFFPSILDATRYVANSIMNIFLGFIIAIYLLYNKESFLLGSRKILTALLPSRNMPIVVRYMLESHKIFTGFFMGKLIDSLIIGLLCFIILLIAHIPYPMLLSVIVGVTNMIPYFGPFIGGGIGIVFLLVANPYKALWFAFIILVLQQFDGNILGPKILGDSTGLQPFWVIFSIVLFGAMFGLMGMFIGVPCFAVIKNIFDHFIDSKYRDKMATGTNEHPDENTYNL